MTRAPQGCSHTSPSLHRYTEPPFQPPPRPPASFPGSLLLPSSSSLPLPIKRPLRPSTRQENKLVSHFASIINLCHVAGSFNGSRHGNEKPVPAALGTKTKLRGGGGRGRGGRREPGRSQDGAGWVTPCLQLSLGDIGETEKNMMPAQKQLRLTLWVFSHGLS